MPFQFLKSWINHILELWLANAFFCGIFYHVFLPFRGSCTFPLLSRALSQCCFRAPSDQNRQPKRSQRQEVAKVKKVCHFGQVNYM